MVAAGWPESLAFVLREEGGNDDDPHDPGGRTSRGIIQREWNTWLAAHPGNNWPKDVWEAPQDQVEAIYKAQYWEPYCDRLPGGIDLEFFDFCVNAGRQRAVKTLQKSLSVGADGMMGIVTWNAVEQANQHALVAAFAENRRSFYRALAQFPRYGKGWLGRTDRCETAAGKLVTTSATAGVPVGSRISPKADPEDLRQPPISPAAGAATTTATITSAGIAEQLGQASSQLSPFQETISIVKYLLLGIAVISILMTIYGLYHQSQTKQLAG